MSKNLLDLLPKNTRYAPENDIYGNLEGYILLLKNNIEQLENALNILKYPKPSTVDDLI